tara:strand:- start:2190 stop:2849 length:660 start_codon:yes stop_codon:yes gene_type:complete
MIVIIGDSHASIFSKKNHIIDMWPKKTFNMFSKMKPIRIGAATAYNLDKKAMLISSVLDNTFYFKNSYVLFCFGEVDIRAHLINQSKLQKKEIDRLVIECIDRYINCINSLESKKIFRKAVWAPIASWSEEKPYDGPSFGTNIERNNVTRIFNSYLEKSCKENNIIYVSIFEELLNSDGTSNSYYLDDLGAGIHLNDKALPLIMKELQSKKLFQELFLK